ncbi:DUF397 domain-containing protein [Streptomyces iranensis]|uniref:DUF397 domain-containing protein n=1 Tax=Streptomyces iranensis TaxID=576784 RepID=UPI0039B7637F
MTTESPRWFKSSYSDGGACIEIAANLVASRGVVPVRDSKDPGAGSLIVFTVGEQPMCQRGCEMDPITWTGLSPSPQG